MRIQAFLPYALTAACFFATTVYAFCLLWGAVIMPGIADLESDSEYLQAFQVMDGRIQNNEPAFVLSWLFSVISVLVAAILAWRHDKTIAIAALLFCTGHVTTGAQNVPRNNRVHALDIASADATTLAELRNEMEGPWQRWNTYRTIAFGAVSVYLLLVLMRLEPSKPEPSRSDHESYETPNEVQTVFSQLAV